jgi:hypothetical protein
MAHTSESLEINLGYRSIKRKLRSKVLLRSFGAVRSMPQCLENRQLLSDHIVKKRRMWR